MGVSHENLKVARRPMRSRFVVAVCCAGLLATGTATRSSASPELTLERLALPGDQVTVHVSESQSAQIALAGVVGQRMKVKMKRRKPGDASPSLSVRRPDGSAADVSDALKHSSKSVSLRRLDVDATGVWRLRAFGTAGRGDVRVKVSGSAPSKHVFDGELADSGSVATFPVGLLPGSEVRVVAKSRGKPSFAPSVELRDAGGNVVVGAGATVPKRGGRTKTERVAVPTLGTYTLHVGGGPGTFRALVSVKSPRVRGRALEPVDVEATPVVASVSPASVDNGGQRVVTLSGAGFAPGATVALQGSDVQLVTPITMLSEETATAAFQLTDESPGVYPLLVRSALGNVVVTDQTLAISNRAPSVGSVTPPFVPVEATTTIVARGGGIDAGAAFEVFRTGDDLPLAPTAVRRLSHDEVELDVETAALGGGAYSIRVTDPDSSGSVTVDAFDVVGPRAAPLTVMSSDEGYGVAFTNDAAMSDDGTRLYVALDSVDGARIDRVNAAPYEVQESRTFPPPVSFGASYRPRVAWNEHDQTVALVSIEWDGNWETAWVRVFPHDDLGTPLLEQPLGTDKIVSQVDVVADSDDGGFVIVWEQDLPPRSAQVWMARTESDGSYDPDSKTLIQESFVGDYGFPTIERFDEDRYVIAYAALPQFGDAIQFRRGIVDGDLEVVESPRSFVSDSSWIAIAPVEIAVAPEGEVLFVYSYQRTVNTIGVECMTFDEFDATPPERVVLAGTTATPDAFGGVPVWCPAREEFVIPIEDRIDRTTHVSRVGRDGVLRPPTVPYAFEGVWPMAYAGKLPGTLGIVLTTDGVPDGVGGTQTGKTEVLAIPYR